MTLLVTNAVRRPLERTNGHPGPASVRENEHQNGHGLLGMRERAAAVGGVLQAAAGPDGRFHVEAVLPLQPSTVPTVSTVS